MIVNVAVPIYRVSCRVGVDQGRPWSVVEELLLWATIHHAKTIGELSLAAALPRQLIVAALSRLMRFRLVELTLDGISPSFRASEYGRRAITSGQSLPYFPKRYFKRVSFVVCKVTGEVFPTWAIRPKSYHKLETEQAAGKQFRFVVVTAGGPEMSPDANFARLSQIAARGLDEELGVVDDRTLSVRSDEFMMVQVSGRETSGLPATAGAALRKVVVRTAALSSGKREFAIAYQGTSHSADAEPVWRPFTFDPRDLVIGSEAQLQTLEMLLASAERRLIMHSTFLRVEVFCRLLEQFQQACRRGVVIDILWGGEANEKTHEKNIRAAMRIMDVVEQDADLNGRFRIHLGSTGSHAKIMLLDQADGNWCAAVGTCNWLYSGFDSVELTVLLRDPALVSDAAVVLQRLAGQRGVADPIAMEMALTAQRLRALPARGGTGRAALVLGNQHEGLIRRASEACQHEFTIGTNRLGSTARPGALMLAEVAARRKCRATVLYTRTSGPVRNRHAKEMAAEGIRAGVDLVRTRSNTIGLHGKFVTWDRNDLVVTSLNWGSAVADIDFAWGEVGVHISADGVAEMGLGRLQEFFPELALARWQGDQ